MKRENESTVFDLKPYLKKKQSNVDAALGKIWDRFEPYPTPLVEAMRYSLEAGGKRLRPILCIAAAEVVGGSETEVMDAACALELVHTYSLIHDDLPAMDDDGFRRGKPTCHKVFGEATAILAGDALLTAAFEVLARVSCQRSSYPQVIHLIARAAGASGMVQGQMMDLASEEKAVSWEDLKILHRLKTGALIEASLQAGAILGGGSSQQVAAVRSYGAHVGLAFQVADDVLDVEGDSRLTGKPVGSDEKHLKATVPSLLGLETAKVHARDLVDHALEELSIFGSKGNVLATLARYIVERNR
jgi:geranylgeranyl diphosphate synthase type II